MAARWLPNNEEFFVGLVRLLEASETNLNSASYDNSEFLFRRLDAHEIDCEKSLFFVPLPSRAISHARGHLRVSRFARRTKEKRETARSLLTRELCQLC